MSGRGIVIGGGIGGLLAARMLAARFERVTVLERYPYPADPASPAPASRRGAPQSRCLHLLMAGGAAAFDEVGARLERSPRRRSARFPSTHPRTRQCSSPLAGCRGRRPASSRTPVPGLCSSACCGVLSRQQANVQVLEGQQVVALLGTGRRVTGVRTAGVDGSGEAVRRSRSRRGRERPWLETPGVARHGA